MSENSGRWNGIDWEAITDPDVRHQIRSIHQEMASVIREQQATIQRLKGQPSPAPSRHADPACPNPYYPPSTYTDDYVLPMTHSARR